MRQKSASVRAVILLTLLLLGSGCGGARQAVVLVPDPDGTVGRAEVSTEAGRQTLSKANDMTTVRGRSAPPSPVSTADADYVQATFSQVMAIEPPPSEKFILLFASGGATLTEESLARLPAIAEAVQRRRAITVRISGHTDAVGSAQSNDALSRERATVVQDLLRQRGVPTEIMELSSHGKGNPLIPTPDGVAEPRNRRVEVVIR